VLKREEPHLKKNISCDITFSSCFHICRLSGQLSDQPLQRGHHKMNKGKMMDDKIMKLLNEMRKRE
jgi:hypothetical protein